MPVIDSAQVQIQRFRNAAEWLSAMGDIPRERILLDPPPGHATEADLLRHVESGNCLCELIDGTLVEKPVGLAESIIAMNLVIQLGAYVAAHNLGTVSGEGSTLRMKWSNRIRLPDVCFFSNEHKPPAGVKVPTLAPDLAVEVISQSNTEAEIDRKLLEYFRSGTRLAWVIYPESRTVDVYRSPEKPAAHVEFNGTLDGEDVVPGFTVAVALLFRNVES